MARLALTNKDSIKSKTPSETASLKKRFLWDEIKHFTSPDMVEMLNHPAGEVWAITGKGYGKNRATALAQIAYLENDYSAQGLMLKKYKTNAGQRLHDSVANMVMELKLSGYDIPDYEKGQAETYRMKKKSKTSNQKIEYASYEDYSSLAGIEAKDLGFYPMVLFDEPVEKDDKPENMPTDEEWESNMIVLKDSVGRSNDRHASARGRDIAPTKYYFTMNPWDDHPIIKAAEKYFPEEEFFNFFVTDLIANHTMMRYVKEIDTLIVRGTKFGNMPINLMERTMKDLEIKDADDLAEKAHLIDFTLPEFKKYKITLNALERHLKKNIKPLYVLAHNAIMRNDKKNLATILGLKYEQEDTVKKTYNLENLQTCNTDLIFKNADDTTSLFMGWDIDQRSGGRFVLTPVALTYKNGKKNIVIGKQTEVKSIGVGNSGERIPYYGKVLSDKTLEAYNTYKGITGNFFAPTIAVDDNQKHWVMMLSNNLPDFKWYPTKFKTKESWRIAKRETWTQTAIDSGALIIDEANRGLISDMGKSYAKQGSEQRFEGGAQADLYDRINSMEYALYFLRGELNGRSEYGKINDYMEEEQHGINSITNATPANGTN